MARLSHPLPWLEPWPLARALAAEGGSQGLVLLEGDGSAQGQRAVLGVNPVEILRCGGLPGEPGARDPFVALAEMERQGGPWLGWLAYEAAAWVEPADHWRSPGMASLWAARHDPLLHFDLAARRCWLEGEDPARLAAMLTRLEALIPQLSASPQPDPGHRPGREDPVAAGAGLPGTAASWQAQARPAAGEPASGRAPAEADSGSEPCSADQCRPSGPSASGPVSPDKAETPQPAMAPIPLEAWHWHTPAGRYAEQVERLLGWIAAGDIFQANLTACCETSLSGEADPLALYARLRHRCPAPFAGLAIAGDGEAIVSASPERFLRCEADGRVETRPIKGTRPRHAEAEADAASAAELICDPKDRAENVMIVDLLRNDLGRVCQPGSIAVPQLVGLESYAQVHHLTSVVTGRLAPGRGVTDLLRACWPGGSISGAPKLRACQRLAELEPVPRGPYCGSLFHLAADGSFDSSILIRSLMVQGRRLRLQAGGGIVADSDPQGEAIEMGWKIRPLLEALA